MSNSRAKGLKSRESEKMDDGRNIFLILLLMSSEKFLNLLPETNQDFKVLFIVDNVPS